ncbi:hypothetical protein MHI32_15320 [Paenibacillus sp. FSL H7-0690]|uniref:hypothetical protein n=1 Tax=Paenibacillus sp. FSL H7-0690 TaxID=2921437 RepID=UPI0030EE9EAB
MRYEKNCTKIGGLKKRGGAVRTQKTRKVFTMLLACFFCFGLSTTAFAASECQDTITVNEAGATETYIGDYASESIFKSEQDTITVNEPGAIETYIGDYSTKRSFTPELETITPNEPDATNYLARATYTLSNVSKPISYNLFKPVSDYVAYPGTVSVSKGVTTTVTASVTGGGGVDVAFLKTNISGTIGSSAAFTTTQTISYPTTKGYKGRIILRYYQEQYTYDVTKLGVKYAGSAFTEAHDQYYALQQVAL